MKTNVHMIKTDTIRELNIERAKLIERLSQAYRLIGAGALYTKWYGNEGEHRIAAKALAKEMQKFYDAGLFGDIYEEASK